MKNNFDFIELADSYIKDELNSEDKLNFEKYCDENPQATKDYEQHRLLFQKLREYQLRKNLKENMESVFSEQHVLKSTKVQKLPITRIKKTWEKYKYTALVAASVALLAVFSTLWMSGFYDNVKENSYQYSLLKRDMNAIKRNVNAQNAVINNINTTTDNAPHTFPEGTYGATGFALTSNGFIATNYHVVRETDSVYVQNSTGVSYKAKVIYIDPAYDLAVLEIIDSSFENTSAIPYTFKEENTDLGQDVFTIGYPREEAVYGSGYLSSNTGFGGDTVS